MFEKSKAIATTALSLGSVSMADANVIQQFTATPDTITVGDRTTFNLRLSVLNDPCCFGARFIPPWDRPVRLGSPK
jgi:hypothetical protein